MVKRKQLSEDQVKAFLVNEDTLVIDEIKATRGPNTNYDPKYAPIAKQLCSRGATDAEMADAFNVSTHTIRAWQATFPGFGDAVRAGKAEIFDPLVERALAMKAVGYAVDVEEVKITKDGDEIRYTVRKHFAPDTTACIFWLKNRQPEKWRDVWKIEHSGKPEIEKMTSEEVLRQIVADAAELGIPLAQLTSATGVVAPLPKTNGKGGNGTTH